ncbi:MAG: RluA family pseudouridine synthase [Anaerolineaceae bacterium]
MNACPELSDPEKWLIYQDDDLLVINKPAGILSIPDGYHPDLPHLSMLLEPVFGKVWIVHRLDRETSGVMMFARNADSHRQLNHQFKERLIHKKYHCLVIPAPLWEALSMSEPLLVDADRRHRTRVNFERGKPAQTHAQVLWRGSQFAVLACEITTGYTHQIRAHLYQQGIGILGDNLYLTKDLKSVDKELSAARLMLHAHDLNFAHPSSGKPMEFVVDYPPDFSEMLEILQTHKLG